MPIAGDDKKAIEVASRLVREAGFEPVVVGGLDMGDADLPFHPWLNGQRPSRSNRPAFLSHRVGVVAGARRCFVPCSYP